MSALDPSLTPDSDSPGSDADEAAPPAAGAKSATSSAPQYTTELPFEEELQQWLVGRYLVEGFLGQGGMGAVYRGLQLPLKRPVAIKILRKQIGNDDFEFEERFKREAYAMAALTHPNIVQVYDCGDAGEDFLFISMELVEGGDLSEAMQNGQVTPEAALALIGAICNGLDAAHERGIVHRDIKPANIFLTAGWQPKVADFGLAKKFDAKETLLTKTGLGMGTPDYAAPEQYEQLPDIDHRADIYSLGVMFYQMLTGSLPRGAYKAPSQRVGTDPRLDAVVAKAMEQDRHERYQTVAEMKADIDHIIATWMAAPQPAVSTNLPPPTIARATGPVPQGTQAPSRTGRVPARQHTAELEPQRRKFALVPIVLGMIVVAVGAFFFLRKQKPLSNEDGTSQSQSAAGSPASSSSSSTAGSGPATPKGGIYVNSLGMKFVPVPGTDVLFCIHETRRKDYITYAEDPAVRASVDGTWENIEQSMPVGRDDNHPVVGVSYDDAVGFCQWLSKREGRIFRLPTDQEWSFAAGIGAQEQWTAETTPETLNGKVPGVFPWGGEFPPKSSAQAGNYSDTAAKEKFPRSRLVPDYTDGFPATAPVMSFKPNALGIYDLGGNVGEWVDDWYNATQREHALRGGSWAQSREVDMLSSFRAHRKPEDRGNNHGFRCVLASSAAPPRPILAKAGVTPAPKLASVPSSAVAPRPRTVPPTPAAPRPRTAPQPTTASSPRAPRPSGDPRLAQLASGFQARYETEAQKPYDTTLAALNQSYVANGIARALAAAQSRSDLAEAVALDEEKKAIEKGPGVPPEDPPDTPPALKVLRATYRAARANLEETRTKNAAPLYDIYLSALDAYTIELTKASKLEEAVKVRALREKIAAQKASGTPPVFSATSAGFTNSLGMKFVPVPGTDILMCIHETRVKDYAAFATENPGRTSSTWQKPTHNGVPVEAGENFPVVTILWDEASAFCEWLSAKEGQQYRLPTDREWSYAVGIADREDKDAPPIKLNGLIKDEYPWGKTWPPPKGAGNLMDMSFKGKFPKSVFMEGYDDTYATTAPVMSFEPNSLGIYDLAGNAWEWCQEWWSERNKQHVVRGAAWAFGSKPDDLLSSQRSGASVRTPDRGFRVVAEAEVGGGESASASAPVPGTASKPLLGEIPIKVPASTLKTTPLIVGAVTAGQKVMVTPNAVRWSGGGSKKGQFCDWRGHNPNSPMKNGIPWMALVAAVGKTEFWAKDNTLSFTVPADGPLALYANDTAGGNEGEADVVVTVSAK